MEKKVKDAANALNAAGEDFSLEELAESISLFILSRLQKNLEKEL